MKGTWSFRVIPINQIANFYRHEPVALGDERVVVRVGLALVVPGGKHLADDDPVPGKDG